MESVTGKPFVRLALEGAWRREEWLGFGLGLLTLTILGVTDVVFDVSAVLVGAFVAAPFVTALFARISATLLVGAAALGLAATSHEWHMGLGAGYWIALATIAGGTLFAAASAWNRQRSRFRGERLRILDEVATIADGSRPLDETLERVMELIVPSVADLCMIDAIHPGGVTRAAVRAVGHPRAEEIEARIRRRAPSLPTWLITGERSWRHIPRWRPRMRDEEVRRMARSEDDLDFLLSLRLRSQVTVPITSRDHSLGALTLLSAWSRRRYTEDDVRFAQIAARRIGLALDNAGLFSDLESVERRMNTVMSIIDEAVVIQSRDGEIVFANPAAAGALGFAEPAELVAASPEAVGERLAIRGERGEPLEPEGLLGPVGAPGSDPATRTLRVTDLATAGERWFRTRSRPIEGPDGVPLYLVTVIEDVTDVKRAEFAQGLLARTGELLASSSDYWRTLDEVARLAVPDFADWCSVNIPAPGGRIEQAALAGIDRLASGSGPERRERDAISIDESGPLQEAVRRGRPRVMHADEIAEPSGPRPWLPPGAEADSLIVVPMAVGGRVVGVLSFVNAPGSRRFDDADLEIASELGRRAGLATENARIAAERARVAETLQRELLPPDLPEMEGWDLATMYRPAGEVSEVGGDFYEAFAVGDDAWVVVLGDISGHGALAASLTAVARHTIRTATTLAGDPAAGLAVLDERLRERDAVALCSVVALRLPRVEAGEGAEVSIWLAGHPQPFVLHDGVPEQVGVPGPLVGIGEAPMWRAETVEVGPGDELIVYTDGVTEARRSDGERFGAERLRERLASADEPATTVARVESALAAYASEEPEDDATLVAIRRSAVGAVTAEGWARPAGADHPHGLRAR